MAGTGSFASGALIIPVNGFAQVVSKSTQSREIQLPVLLRYSARDRWARDLYCRPQTAALRPAGSQQKLLAMPGRQHIQADADMSVKEPLIDSKWSAEPCYSHEIKLPSAHSIPAS